MAHSFLMMLIFSTLSLLLDISNGFILNNSSKFFHKNIQEKLAEILNNGDLIISSQCRNDLLQYVHGLKSGEEWALRMLDAGTTELPSGILDGNLFDLGSFDECLNIQERKEQMHITGKYCIGRTFVEIPVKSIKLNFGSNSTTSLLRPQKSTKKINLFLAKCFPDDCSITEMEKVYLEIGDQTDLSQELCQTKAAQPKLDTGAITTISLFGVIFALVILSTVYDVVCYYSKKVPRVSIRKAPEEFDVHCKALERFCQKVTDEKFAAGTSQIKLGYKKARVVFSEEEEDRLQEYLKKASDIYFALTPKEVRRLTYDYGKALIKWLQEAENMYVNTTEFGVDTFFLISGLLVSYNYMKQMKRGVKFNIISYYINRYFRVTSVLAILIIFHITLLNHMGSGPLWSINIESELIGDCNKAWWRSLFHIINIQNTEGLICIPASWYATVDMQLYILSPILLLSLKRWPKFTLLITGLLTICSAVGSFVIGWHYELNPLVFGNFSGAKVFKYLWHYYYQFYTWASSWLLGFILGYLIFESMEKKVKFPNKAVISIFWMISLMTISICIFGGREFIFKEYNTITYSLHFIFARPAWVIAVGWVIFACFNGYGGPVQWFLSLPLFHVVSKLSYTLFLCHWTVISVMVFSTKTITPFHTYTMYNQFWGDYAWSLAISLVLLLAIEFPVNNIIKLSNSK